MILSNIRFIGQFVEESDSLSEKLRTRQRHGDANKQEEFSAVGVWEGREMEIEKDLFDCSYVVTYIDNIG